MKDGSYEDGTITNGNVVYTTVRDTGGETRTIQKSDIVDIDHPGNIHIIAGSIITALGILPTLFGMALVIDYTKKANDPDYRRGSEFGLSGGIGAFFLVVGLSELAVGVPMLVWGLNTWNGSRTRLDSPGIDKVELSIGNGLGLKVTF